MRSPRRQYRSDRLQFESLEDRRCLAPLLFTSHDVVTNANAFRFDVNDYNADGDLDLLAGPINGQSWLYEKTSGLNEFELVREFDRDHLDGIFADMDGDGDGDLVTIITTTVGAGDELTQVRDLIWIEDYSVTQVFDSFHLIAKDGDFQSLEVLDLDGDGDQDVLSRPISMNGSATDRSLHENQEIDEFAPPILMPESSSFQWFWDRDGDGDLDSIEVDDLTERLRSIENIDNVFQPAEALLDSDGQPLALTSIAQPMFADMDGDGDGDIVAATHADFFSDKDVFWFEQESDGMFRSQRIVEQPRPDTFSHSVTIWLADMDGDSDLDIVTDEHQTSEVGIIQVSVSDLYWYENQDGSFGIQHRIAEFSNQSPLETYLEDFDGDGDIDALFAMGSDSLYRRTTANDALLMFENVDGLGTFEFAESILKSVEEPILTTAADIDGDGDLDLLSAAAVSGYVFWVENRGNGDFGNLRTVAEPLMDDVVLSDPEVASAHASDLDNDGDLDVIIAARQDNAIYWVQNLDGAGNFGVMRLVSDKPLQPTEVATGDLDNDGDQDIVALTFQEGDITWYRNKNADDDFSSPRKVIDGPNWSTLYTDLELLDLDGDGFLDVLAAGDEGLHWFRNTNGRGDFAAPVVIDDTFRHTATIDVGDIDLDGDTDVILASSSGPVFWYQFLGPTLGFAEPQLIGEDTSGGNIELADLDGDGDLDAVVGFERDLRSRTFMPGIGWHENVLNGSEPTFSPLRIITSHVQSAHTSLDLFAFTVDVADLDGDGVQDVITSNANRNEIDWFTTSTDIDFSSWHNSAFPVDVDNSGIVAPVDALLIINELNERVYTTLDGWFLESERPANVEFLDVDGNGLVSPADALNVINALNSNAELVASRGSWQSIAIETPVDDESEDASAGVTWKFLLGRPLIVNAL